MAQSIKLPVPVSSDVHSADMKYILGRLKEFEGKVYKTIGKQAVDISSNSNLLIQQNMILNDLTERLKKLEGEKNE